MTDSITKELTRVVTFANCKGGTGATSTAVNVAGLAAEGGWRTLFIDLDPYGNAGHDLGYYWDGRGDSGKLLRDALMTGSALVPVIPDVRPGLDVISGGEALDDWESMITGPAKRSSPYKSLLAEALEPIAPDYDLIVLDTPSTRPALIQLALYATRWIVVPTRADRASIEGLRVLSRQIETARDVNPDIELLGVVLFDVATSATAVRRNAASDIMSALNGAAPLLKAVIQHSESSAVKARENGVLIHELADQADDAEQFSEEHGPESTSALAEDYLTLSQEVLQRIRDVEQTK
ncbi:ParA family protein [Rhodococcus sp. BP22]|uniref:ParA family protein n=1 Tax=Rhodococcus sp. BP22 TaxID=2758566 RepID=UPI0028F70BF7|nr:ParA family protein [Rhodococcus sp. BP22]